MKIAAIADIHIRTADTSGYQQNLLQIASKDADILLIGGDLTQEGLHDEAVILKKLLQAINIPVVTVLGNHDFENGNEKEIAAFLKSPTVHILNGDFLELKGIGFAGIKGFGGGFTNKMIPKFGEKLLKQFVDEGANETLLLEKALSQLDTKIKIVVMHYSPIRDTVVGEPEEIFPFLGLTRLEEAVNRANVTMVFHGHAHHGTYSGKTSTGIPVFNVALPVLQKENMTVSLHEVDI